MKTFFNAKILNPYRSRVPKGFYDRLKGHTGVDLEYVYENLFSPITGEVIGIFHQPQMGNCLYIKDVKDNIHVFAHMSRIGAAYHQKIKRGDMLGITGNSGRSPLGGDYKPHLHYEIICTGPKTSPFDYIMTRSLMGYNGYNRDPIKYLTALYNEYGIPIS